MADKCGKCEDTVKSTNSVKCQSCEGVYHPQCVTLCKTRSGSQTTWRCDSCKTDVSSVDSESTTNAVMCTLQAIRKEISDNMKESRDRFTGLDECMKEVREVMSDVKQKLRRLEEDNVEVRKLCSDNSEALQTTSEEVYNLRSELIELQQYMRRSNLEIKGIPYTANENIYSVMEHIARVLGVSYHRGDFSVVHRLPASKTPGHPTIIAAFISRSVRNTWYAASRKKNISTTDISQSLAPGTVFINVHLTAHNKQLLGRAKRLVRERKLSAAWTTIDGKVLVKKAEGEKATRIFLLEDLDK